MEKATRSVGKSPDNKGVPSILKNPTAKSGTAQPTKQKRVSFFEFKGLMAPVFTCFRYDIDCSLELRYIDRYAQWLKSERINGILVNAITGEGSVLGVEERKVHAEAWWEAVTKYDLVLMVQIGAAPLHDVLDLASHAEKLGVHAVLCIPELFYKPRNVEELVGYCKIVAKACSTRPFFYYHIPEFTGIAADMAEFCSKAEEAIPNFFGIQYSSINLDNAVKCLKPGRVVMLGAGSLLSSAMLLGFESFMFSFLNGRPKLFWDIFNAMQNNDVALAKKKQAELNSMIQDIVGSTSILGWVPAAKAWFNKQMRLPGGAGFTAGPARRFW